MRSFRLAGPVVGCLVEDGDRYEAETHLTVVRLDSGERWSSDPENRQTGSLTGFTEIAVNRLALRSLRVRWTQRGKRHKRSL